MRYNDKIQKFLYYRSPYFIKNLVSTYYEWHKSYKKYGTHYQRHFDTLSKTQWMTTKELLDLQQTEVLKFIRYAYNHVPYYKKLFDSNGLSLSDINCLDDIQNIPVLTKEVFRQNSQEFLSNVFDTRDIYWDHTSGTTGKALRIALSKECYQRDYAFYWVQRSACGTDRKTSKVATFAGHPIAPIDRMKPPFWVYNYYEKQLLFSSYHLSKNNLQYYAKELGKFQPDLIHGYPSSIYLVANYLLENKINNIRPKCIITASETLFDHQKSVIHEAFDCMPLTHYGNAERAGDIDECPEGGKHIKYEHSYIEFLDEDNEPAKPGCEGRIVCTAFGNYAMPLIRYDLGDIAIPLYRDCNCGRGGYIVERIVGRVDDYIVTPDGRFVGRLGHLFKDSLNVEEAQLYQDTPEKLVIRIIKRPAYSEYDEKLILNEARNRLGNIINIEFEYVSKIPRTSSGKQRFVVSKIDFGNLKMGIGNSS